MTEPADTAQRIERQNTRAAPRTAAGCARMFLALMPSPGTQCEIGQWCNAWHWPPAAVRTRAQRFHLTLHFLGDIPEAQLPRLRDALQVTFAPFALDLGVPSLWKQGTAVLRPRTVPDGLVRLHHALLAALHSQGLHSRHAQFVPHITLARQAVGAQPPFAPLALQRSVRRYALIRSDLRMPATYFCEQEYVATE